MKLNDDIKDTLDIVLVFASVFLTVYKVLVVFSTLIRKAIKQAHHKKVN